MNKTRYIQPTESNLERIPHSNISSVAIYLNKSNMVTTYKHHEGLFQMVQPNDFGPSSTIRNHVVNLAVPYLSYYFIDKLNKISVKPYILNEDILETQKFFDVTLSIDFKNIYINTYGDIFAGDYWEVEVLSSIRVCLKNSRCNTFQQTSYGKVLKSPVIIGENFIEVIGKAIIHSYSFRKQVSNLSNNLMSYKDTSLSYDSSFKYDFNLEKNKTNPFELCVEDILYSALQKITTFES